MEALTNERASKKKDESKRFINPYNFVPFAGQCQRKPMEELAGGLTGYIECELTPLTALFIPNTSNDQALYCDKSGKIHSYDFFSYTNLEGKSVQDIRQNPAEPVIPGSEIRGAVCGVYEAAFNGCLSSVDLERTLNRRSNLAKLPGILRKTEKAWEIQPCRRLMLNVKCRNEEEMGALVPPEKYQEWQEGEELYVKERKAVYQTSSGYKTEYHIVDAFTEEKPVEEGWEKGYLHKGEAFARKHHESVFVASGQPSIPVCQADVENLERVLELYRARGQNRSDQKSVKETWYPAYAAQDDALVYYALCRGTKEGEGFVYMSPACLGKEVFHRSVETLIRENGGYQPCETREEVCAACALFGMVGPGEKGQRGVGAISSRVRFGDATLVSPPERWEMCYGEICTLPEMGEPKPSAAEFYLQPPVVAKRGETEYDYWTYDYKVKEGKYVALDQKTLKLRGRKFYWHSLKERILKDRSVPTKMRQKIRPLVVGKHGYQPVFQNKIYFENLTEKELQQLCWALDFGNPSCAHKIGRAKPLGFGSVRIEVKHVRLRKIDPETGMWEWQEGFERNDVFNDGSEKCRDALQTILNWEKKPNALVAYPLNRKGEEKESYEWFGLNQKKAKSKPGFFMVLPKIEEEVKETKRGKWLYCYEK